MSHTPFSKCVIPAFKSINYLHAIEISLALYKALVQTKNWLIDGLGEVAKLRNNAAIQSTNSQNNVINETRNQPNINGGRNQPNPSVAYHMIKKKIVRRSPKSRMHNKVGLNILMFVDILH